MKNQQTGLAAALRNFFQKAGSNPVEVNGTGLKFHPMLHNHQVVFLGKSEDGQEVHFTPFPQSSLGAGLQPPIDFKNCEFVYDADGTKFPEFIVNPLDERNKNWSIADEIAIDADGGFGMGAGLQPPIDFKNCEFVYDDLCKFGITHVAAISDFSQLDEIYGNADSEIMTAACIAHMKSNITFRKGE